MLHAGATFQTGTKQRRVVRWPKGRPILSGSGAAIGDARYVYGYSRDKSPLKRNVELAEVGNAGLYLLSGLSGGVTGEVMFVDSGFHTIGIPKPDNGE